MALVLQIQNQCGAGGLLLAREQYVVNLRDMRGFENAYRSGGGTFEQFLDL